MPLVELALVTLATHKLAVLTGVGAVPLAPLASLAWKRCTTSEPIPTTPLDFKTWKPRPRTIMYDSQYSINEVQSIVCLASIVNTRAFAAQLLTTIDVDLKTFVRAGGKEDNPKDWEDPAKVANDLCAAMSMAPNLSVLNISLPGGRRRSFVIPPDKAWMEKHAVFDQIRQFVTGVGPADGPLSPVLRSIGLGKFA